MTSNYSYSSEPQVAPVGRTSSKSTGKYRDENDAMERDNLNLMQDPRVRRGNTYAADVVTKTARNGSPSNRHSPMKTRKNRARKNYGEVPPVEGRVHMEIQTEEFLEELTDRPIEIDAETQTLAYMDRPKSPLFIPSKTGHDVDTQIMPGDLFDFDLEVEPILEVIVGRTMHVAMLELMQEDELDAIFKQQQEFEAIRNIELSEVQRLEADARRKAEERDRRVLQEKKRLIDRLALEEKVASRAFANQYLSDLHSGIFNELQDEGYFYDPVKKEIEDLFMPDLLSDISNNTTAFDAARNITDELLKNVKTYARDMGMKANKMRQALKDRLEKEAEEKRIAEEATKKAEEAAAAVAEVDDGAEE